MIELKIKTIEWLKKELENKGYNYRTLADKTDVSRTTVIRWMKGEQFPKPDKFKTMSLLVTNNITHCFVFEEALLHHKLFMLRHFEGLTISEMSIGAMVNVNLLRKWENGSAKPDQNQLRRLMNYFDVTPEIMGLDFKTSTFGSRIQEERMALELTQADVAYHLNKSKTIVSHYENDKMIPTDEDIFKLADIFGHSVESLIVDESDFPYEGFARLYIEQIRPKQTLNV